MNSNLAKLQSYPFEKLAKLIRQMEPPSEKRPIVMSVGEPRQTAPHFIGQELCNNLDGLSRYPVTQGGVELRSAITQWLAKRFALKPGSIDEDRNVLPVNGTREALFAFAQCVVDAKKGGLVLMPNPFYQIYEGAALLAGAEPWYINATEQSQFLPDFDSVPSEAWQRCQVLYLCSPGNPTGAVLGIERLKSLIELADQYDFVIASDECYSEIYFNENSAPAGLLEAAHCLGRDKYERCVVFNSLSKRSSVPGLRSGFVAGDENIIERFRLYRTYHGCAMSPPAQAASTKAWQDEQHVVETRQSYRERFRAIQDIVSGDIKLRMPEGGFFIWLPTGIDDQEFARELYAKYNLTVLPGSFLSRVAQGVDPGSGYVRIAVVGSLDECREAALRLKEFLSLIKVSR